MKLAIIATQGKLDLAYPPLILATTAAAVGYDVQVFCTFYGLHLLRKDVSGLRVSPIGNPAMPMKMPFGPKWLRGINLTIPNFVQTNMPGFESMATAMMKKTMKEKGVAGVEELRTLSLEADVKFIGCQMTVDLFGFKRDEFIDGLEFAGATSFFEFAGDAEISLYM